MKNPKGKWAGEAGIGSGFTGGDHLAYQVMFPGVLLGVFFGIRFVQALIHDPVSVALCWGPVLILGTAAFLMRRRHRKAFLILWILTLLTGLCALASVCAPA